jgi:predicted DNA-binding transcriptional regulator AlpA
MDARNRNAHQTPNLINPHALYRLSQVLQFIPVSRSTWWQGVRESRYPAPVKLGPATTCWRGSDLLALIENAK